MAYVASVVAKLNDDDLKKRLSEYTQKSQTIKLDINGNVLQTVTKLENGMGKVATVTEKADKVFVSINNDVKKWAESQESLRGKLENSSTQLQAMAQKVENLSSGWKNNVSGVDDVKNRIASLQAEYSNLINNNERLSSTELQRLNQERQGISQSISLLQEQNRTVEQSTETHSNSLTRLVAQYISLQAAIRMATTLVREMVEAVFTLDSALTELSKVSGIAKDELGSITDEAYEIGERVSAVGSDVVDAITNMKRAGYEMSEALDLGEATLKMVKIADGIDDVDTATEVLVSTLKGFGLQVSDTEHILDAMNEIGNTSATTFGNLADVLQRSSATMSTSGNSLEETLGMATGILEILGSKPEIAGRALNSLSMRLRGLSQISDDGYEGISKLNTELERLGQKYGVASSVFDDKGNLKSTFDIMANLSELYPKLTENEKQYIATQAAGKTMISSFNALMVNWEGTLKATETALNSTGSAEQEMERYNESLQASLDGLKSAFEQLAVNSINSGFVKGILEATTGTIKFMDAIGGLPTILISVSGAFVLLNLAKIQSGFSTAATTVGFFMEALAETRSITDALTVATNASTAATVGLKLAMGGIIALGIAGVIWGVTAAFDAMNVSIEEQQQKVNDLNKELDSLQSAYDSVANKTNKSQADEDYLDILQMQIELQKESIELENQRLAQKEIFGTLQDAGAYETLSSSMQNLNAVFDEYNVKMKLFNEATKNGDASAEQYAEELLGLRQSMITLGGETGDALAILQKYKDSLSDPQEIAQVNQLIEDYSTTLKDVKAYQEDVTRSNGELTTTFGVLAEKAKAVAKAVSEDESKAIEDLDDKTNDCIDTINTLNSAIANQEAGMALSYNTTDDLLRQYPELQGHIQQTSDGYVIEQGVLEDLRIQCINSYNAQIDGSVKAKNQVIEDCKAQIKSLQAVMIALASLSVAWGGTTQYDNGFGVTNQEDMDRINASKLLGSSNSAINKLVGGNEQIAKFQEQMNKTNQTISDAQKRIDEALEGLADLGNASNRVALAENNLGNEIADAADKAEKAAKSASKEIKDYTDDIAKLGDTLKDTCDDLESLKKNLDLYKQGKVTDAFKATTMSLEEIELATEKAEKQLVSLVAQYEKLSKNTTGDAAKKAMDNLKDSISATNSEIKELTNQAKALNDALKEAAKAQIKAESSAANDLISIAMSVIKDKLNAKKDAYQDEIDLLEDEYDAKKDALKEMVEARKDALQEEYDALKESYEARKKAIKAEADATTKKLKEELSAYQDIINKRKELLDTQEDERTYQEDLAELNKELADLQSSLLNAQLDDSLEGKKKQKELTESIAKKEKEIWELQNAWRIEQEKAALDAELEAKTEKIESEIEKVEDACDKETDLIDDMLDDKEKQLKEDLAYWEKYQEAQEKALEESLKEQKAVYESCIADIETKLSQSGQIRLQAIAQLEDANSGMYEKAIEYNRLYGDGVDTTTKKIETLINALKKYNDYAGIVEAEEIANSGSFNVDTENDNKVSSTDTDSSSELSEKGKQQLNQQKYLHDLAVQAQADGNENLLKWIYSERAKWGMDKYGNITEQFHEGGLVCKGGQKSSSNLKSGEKFAKLLDTEYVATEQDMNKFVTNTLPNILGAGQIVNNSTSSGDTINATFNIEGNVDPSTLNILKSYVDKGIKGLSNVQNARRKGYSTNASQFTI